MWKDVILVPLDYTPMTGDMQGVLNSMSNIRAMETDYSYIIYSHKTTVIWKVVVTVPKSKCHFAFGY